MSLPSLVELATFVSKAVVSEPEMVQVTEDVEDDAVTVKVTVSPKDVGRLIGRKGRTIEALRTLVGVVAAANGQQAGVEVVEPT